MDKKLLKSILLIMTFSAALVAIIINIDKISGAVNFIWKILLPVIVGFCIAFLLNRPYCFLLKQFRKLDGIIFKKKKSHANLCKALSIISVYLIFLSLLALLFGLIIPQLGNSLSTLYGNKDIYIENIVKLTALIEEKLSLDISILQEIENLIINLIEQLPSYLANIIPKVFDVAGNVANSITNALMGFALSIYMLASKDMLLRQCRSFLYAFFPLKFANKASDFAKLSSDIFGDYINGQLLDALVVGILCFIGMSILRLPYALLISTIIAVTNVIPIFGPFIGAIPSAFILLIGNPIHALWFVIFILVLQQIDGNIICPRIVGDSVGLPSWWVLIAILIGSGVLGFIGMLIGVPIFCIIYKLLSDVINKKLEKNFETK